MDSSDDDDSSFDIESLDGMGLLRRPSLQSRMRKLKPAENVMGFSRRQYAGKVNESTSSEAVAAGTGLVSHVPVMCGCPVTTVFDCMKTCSTQLKSTLDRFCSKVIVWGQERPQDFG